MLGNYKAYEERYRKMRSQVLDDFSGDNAEKVYADIMERLKGRKT